MRMAAALGMAMLLASQAAAAQQVHFTGRTTADPTLIRDVLQQLARHAYATQGCTALTAVSSLVLPQNFEPGLDYGIAATSVTYERWNTTLCGRSVAYLVGFWPSPEGGTMFQLSHPFPEHQASSSR